MLLPFFIPILLFLGQDLANSEFQLDHKIGGKSECKNPKGKIDETIALWEKDNVFKDSDDSTSSRIIPIDFLDFLISILIPDDASNQLCFVCWLYNPTKPYCQGSCNFGLRCNPGPCRSKDSPAKECIQHALGVSYNECETKCKDHGTTCHSCITNYVPENCQSFESFNECASCSRPIYEAHMGCQTHADLLQCVRDTISQSPSSTCEPCIGSIGCKLFSSESDICTHSQNIPDLWIHSDSCPASWIRSENDLQVCFKVFELEKPCTWNEAETFCTDSNWQLAISDSKNKINSITDSLGDTNAKESWISGKQTQSSPSTFKWLPVNKNVTQKNWSGKCPNGKTNTCMYVDENGYWCNQDCNEKYNVVCQQNINV